MPSLFLQEICSLIGQPVAGNPTQFMMEKAFAHHGLDWRYLSLEVAPGDLGDAVRGLRALGFRGANIAHPHQVAVVEFLDRLSERAQKIGAVNCIVREGRELVGHNTDGQGFLQSLRTLVDPTGKQVVLLGAGGAARAIGVELGRAGASRITVVNRSPDHGQALADLLTRTTQVPSEFVVWHDKFEVSGEVQVLVQATSIGLDDPQTRVPVNFKHASPELVAADVVFNPPETRFLAEAHQHGLKTLDGLGMIVHQGALAFQLWTGIAPDVDVLRDAVEEFLA